MSSKRDEEEEEADITSVYQAMMAAQMYAQNSSINTQSESRQTNYHVAASQQQYPLQHQPKRDASHLQAIHTPPVVHAYNNNATNASQVNQHTMQQQMQLLSRERWEQQLIPHPQPQQIGGQVFNPNYNNTINSQLEQTRERVMMLSQHHAQLKATSERIQQEINYKMLLESQQRNTSSTQQQHQTQLMIKAQQYNMNRKPSLYNARPIATALNSSVEQQQQYQHNHSAQSEHKMKVYQLPQHEQYTRQPQQQLFDMNVDTDGASDIQCSSFDSAPPVATALNSSIVDQQIQQQKLLGKEKKKPSTVHARKSDINKKAKQDSKEIKVRVKVNDKTCKEGVTVAVKGCKRITKKMAVAKKRKGKLKKEEESVSTESSDSSDEETLVNNKEASGLVTFHCRKCNEDCSFPANRGASGKFAMHVRYCKGKKNTQVVKVSPKKKSSQTQKSTTLICKFCNKSFTLPSKTAAASFANHERSCDPNQIAITKGKKRKKSPEEKTPTIDDTTQPTPNKSKSCQTIRAESSYPYAPLGNLWLEKSLSKQSIGDAIVGRRCVWDEGYFVDGHLNPQPQISYDEQKQTNQQFKGGQCNCGSNHLNKLLNTLIDDTQPNDDKESSIGRSSRRSQKSSTASSSSTISSQLARGNLDPHTLIQCEEYELGPEFRLLDNLGTDSIQPFAVRVSPDVTFLTDLHAHMCDSEIIGLLGGRYSTEEKCIYIQAAFPCKSTDRADSGSTDVEMDPIGQIYTTEAITNHGMSIVGWYHSHPDFQPTPSITDIENQATYQQLFQGESSANKVSPFVGLIIGTYDSKNLASHSIMKWFHVQSRDTPERKGVNFPMNLKTFDRQYRKMTLDSDETSTANIRRSLTLHGTDIRHRLESRYLSCPASGIQDPVLKQAIERYAARKGSTQGSHPEEAHAFKQNANVEKLSGEGKASSLSVLEAGKDRKESSLNQSSGVWKFSPADHLHFDKEEHAILEMKQGLVPDDVIAGIIWHSIERDQQILPKQDTDEAASVPASSRSILELLLRQSLDSSNVLQKKLYTLIQCLGEPLNESALESQLVDCDAMMIHCLDVVLATYCTKLNRVNPFTSWSGAGDKGKEFINDRTTNTWVDYYSQTILKMKPQTNGSGRRGGSKMKRGHKITSSLLRWARSMQINSAYNTNSSCGNMPNEFQYIYFVSEVMRLMAARWRQSGSRATRPSTPRSKKQGSMVINT